MRYPLALCLLLVALGAQAQIYRWVDPATGKTMFSDTPPPGNAKTVSKSKEASQGDGLSFATKQAAENFPVILYTAADCLEECKQARDLLNKRGVPFTEKMVQTQAEQNEVKQAVGDVFIPSIKVGKQPYRGFQADAYNNLLNLAGYPSSAQPGSKPASGLPR